MKIVVLERMSVGADVDLSPFEEYGEVVYYDNARNRVKEVVLDADIIVANKSKLNEETLKDAKNLKLICEFATGFDNVDIEYCKKRGIVVTNVKGYSTQSVAQHTFAMVLYLLERLPFYDQYVKSGAYSAQDQFSVFPKVFTELEGKTWGIIGLGEIGRMVAKIAKAFGCKVIYYSVTGKNTNKEYESVSFDTLLETSDIVSVHCPLSELTLNLIDYNALKKMKTSAILVNVARGPVVNNADLAKALLENEIMAAGLDVLEKEPMEESNPLFEIKDSDKLYITPHIGWASIEARTRLVEEVCKNIDAYLIGEKRNVVSL